MLLKSLERQGRFLFKYRGILPIFILIPAILTLYYGRQDIFMKELHIEEIVESGGIILSLVGVLLRIITVGFSLPHTSGRNTTKQIAQSLSTNGPYSLVRHPLYLGNFVIWLGLALLTFSLWFVLLFVMFFCLYYERIIFMEEQFLHKRFGQAYSNWTSTTPAFIPKLKGYRAPGVRFNIKKVILRDR